jgi:hypothetical protein
MTRAQRNEVFLIEQGIESLRERLRHDDEFRRLPLYVVEEGPFSTKSVAKCMGSEKSLWYHRRFPQKISFW